MRFINPFRKRDSNVKNVSVAQLDQFLLYLMRGSQGGGNISELRRVVPWLFRSIDTIAQKTADFPFEIQDLNGNIVDSSQDWQNVLEFTKDFKTLLFKISASLNLHGQAYIFPASNRLSTAKGIPAELRYYVPQSITPIITEQNGLERFDRQTGTIKTPIKVEDLLYFWLPDPDVELGPPLAYPAKAALNAAGVLSALDKFFDKHAKSGLIRAFIANVKNAPNFASEQGQAAKEKIEEQLNRTLTGEANEGAIRAINADSVTITAIGEGLKELENVELTDEKRADIAVAMNMPATYIWSGDASGIGGGGVSKEDTFRLYDNNIVPGFNFIAGVFNPFFQELGYKIIGKPETLDVFQEDEVSRTSALSSLTTAINTDPSTAKFSMSILGYELDEEQEVQLEELIAGKQLQREQATQAAEQAQQNQSQQFQTQGNQDTEEIVKKSIEAGQYKRFIEKHPDKAGAFVFHHLTQDEQRALGAQTSVTVKPFRQEYP